jgi:CheY-like chemotaxis protein
MPRLLALCADEATIVLCSRLADVGFHVTWAHMEDVRQGRVEPEALLGDDVPDVVLFDIDEPVDESLLLLTFFRSLPGMGAVPVILVHAEDTVVPESDAPGIAAVLTRPCAATVARGAIASALGDRYDETV